jgi:hypothetical protein
MQQIGVLNLHVQLDKHPAHRDGAIVLWNPSPTLRARLTGKTGEEGHGVGGRRKVA